MRPRRERPLDLETVRKRNPVERIKHEKAPLALLDELPRLAATHYEAVDEEDVLRLQWLGLYHDKPRVGEFMLRVKLPGGVVTPAQLEAIGALSVEHGKSSGEITTRQDLQLHHVRLSALPEVFARLQAARLSSVGACGDVLRNITSCPVAGLDPRQPFDTGPLVQRLAARFGGPEYGDLPRKHKWTLSACPDQCNAPEIHDVGLVGLLQDGAPGFALRVGGGLSTVPRIGASLGVFVPLQETEPVLGAVLEIWKSDLTYRRSRGKSRFKFMVDDLGPEALRERLEQQLGRRLADLHALPEPRGRTGHLGQQRQRDGRWTIGVPVPAGLLSGKQMLGLGRLVARHGADVRFTREQNLLVTGIAESAREAASAGLAALGLRPELHPLWGSSIACTGNPHCNFAVGETKPRLVRLVRHLIERFGEAVAGLRIHLDGCPHACGQHWVGDLGFQGTTRTTAGGRVMAYDVLLRGGLGAKARIGRQVLRKVPSDLLDGAVERLIAAWLETGGETFQQFCIARDDPTLRAIAGVEETA